MRLKYGRLPVRHDVRTLHLKNYLTADLPQAPDRVDYESAVDSYPMYLNDKLGCCTCAAMAHMVQSWTQYGAGADVAVTDQDVLTAYEAVSGYDPQTGANDNGAVEVDVLNYWRKQGIGSHKIGAWVKVDHTNLAEVRQAIYLFGGVYTGFLVSESAENTVGRLWKADNTEAGKNILGGHAVPLNAYRPDGFDCITWGQIQSMTNGFFEQYFEEAYAIVSQDWLNPKTGLAPNGLDVAKLNSDLKAIGA